MFLLAGLGLVARTEDARPVIFLVYLFMLAVAPLIAASLIYVAEGRSTVFSAVVSGVLGVTRVAFLCLFLVLIAKLFARVEVRLEALLSWLAVIVPVVGVFAIVCGLGRQREFFGYCDAALVVAMAAAVFALSPFNAGATHPIGLVSYAMVSPNFGLWLLVGAGWTAVGIWLRSREGWAFPRSRGILLTLAIAAVSLEILSLYDDSHLADFAHYTPLVGPAMHTIAGGIPMVDVYSQYGLLTWLVHRLAFAVFEPSFGVSAVVVRLFNLCFFAAIFLTLYFVSRRRLSALWFLIPAFLVALSTHNPGAEGSWNMNALPMTLGGRWLLPAAMTLLLVAAPRRPWTQQAALAIIALASLSSVDILVFTLAPWGCCLALDALRMRSLVSLLVRGIQACVVIALAHVIFASIVYVATGRVVDYRPYFDLFYQNRPAEASLWSGPFVPYYALWLPIGAAYFLLIALAVHRAVRGVPPVSIVERLFPVVIFALGPLAYFFGKPQEGTLNLACISFAVVAIGIAEVVFFKPRRLGPAGVALSAVMALAFAFTIADGLEHFMRPLDPIRGNSSILRRCLSQEGCQLASIPRSIALAITTQPLDPRVKVSALVGGDRGGRARIEEMIAMLKRLGPQQRQVGMLTDFFPVRYGDSDMFIGGPAFMSTGQWYAWGTSAPVIDGLSPVITEQILKRVDATPSGMPVVISNQRDGWGPINPLILARLMARCRLSPVEAGKYDTVYVTENCGG